MTGAWTAAPDGNSATLGHCRRERSGSVSGPIVWSSSITETRPAVRHDQPESVLMPGPGTLDEVDLDPIDLGRELRPRVHSRLALAPVIVGRRSRASARIVAGCTPCGQSGTSFLLAARRRMRRRRWASVSSGTFDAERPDFDCGLDGVAHECLLLVSAVT